MSTNLAAVPPPPDSGEGPQDSGHRHLEPFFRAWGFFFFLIFGVACGLYSWKSGEANFGYISTLFFVPLLQVPSVIWMLRVKPEFRARGSFVLMPALGMQMTLWGMYTFKKDLTLLLGPMAWASLGSAVALAIVAIRVTSLIMGKSGETSRRFKLLLQSHPFIVTCFFLTVFTFVAYFLSLALAFHDQGLRLNRNTVGLYAAQVVPSLPPSVPVPPGGEVPENSSKILFARGSATVDIDLNFEELTAEKQTVGLPEDARRKALNLIRLKKVVKEIAEHSSRDRVRVVLVGHSDDTPVGTGSYKSNFELSQARIHQVMLQLLSRLEDQEQTEWRRNIEWLFLPSANENGFLDGRNDRDGKERLSVEIALYPSYGDKFSYSDQNGPLGRNLELLDYVYFGVYTITTTGYGDIIPVTSFAKLITTVANFFEVFLMVIFFNVLISFFNSGPVAEERAT